MTDNPPMSYKRLVASILARKSKKRIRLPRSVSSVSPFAEVEAISEESSEEFINPFEEMIVQPLAENKKEAKVPDTTYYTISEAAKKLGLSDQTIRRMCENKRFIGAYRSGGEHGHWRIPEDNFITTKEQDQKAEMILKQLDKKNEEAGDLDEFDL